LKTSEYQDEMARRKVNFPDLPTMLLISLQVVSQLAKEKSRQYMRLEISRARVYALVDFSKFI
jgi:hypothetical protein